MVVVCVFMQIPDVVAVAVATATTTTTTTTATAPTPTATVVFESPESRSSTPDELTPALVQHGDGNPPDDDDSRTDTVTCTMAATGANRSTSFGEYIPIGYLYIQYNNIIFCPEICLRKLFHQKNTQVEKYFVKKVLCSKI